MIGLEAFSNNAAILTAAQNSQQFNSMQAKKAEKSSKLSFADSLKKSEAEAALAEEGLPLELAGMTEEEAIIFLKDEVDIASDEIRFHQSFEALANYRNKVSHLLKYISRNNYDVIMIRERKKLSSGRIINPMFQIRVIDQKLNQLMSETILNQHRGLRLLAKIGEINGLIVDLLQ